MKFLQFQSDYDTHKKGAVHEFEDSDAAVGILTKAGIAKEVPAPATVDDAAKKAEEAVVKGLSDSIAAKVLEGLKVEGKGGNRPQVGRIHDNADDDPTFGFKTFGDQIRSIKGWYGNDANARSDERLKRILAKAPTTYASEGTGADGGFLLAPNYANTVLQWSFSDEALFTRTDTYTTGSNSLTVPKDETTPWGTNGVQVFWQSEAGQATQSKPKFGQDNLILQKLTALVPVTDEQLQDSFVGLGQYVAKQAGQRIRFKVDEAIVNGTGAGQPLGIINSGAIVTQAAEGGQTAGTINITNIAKMISRVPGASLKNLVWLVHPSAFPQLVILTNANQSLYIAPGQVADKSASMGSLMGIPLIISQHAQNIGTPGDIFLLDLSQYITLTKGDGIQSAMSIHLFFDYNVSTFRFNFRVAGQPWAQAPITSLYGSYQLSPFVNLASR